MTREEEERCILDTPNWINRILLIIEREEVVLLCSFSRSNNNDDIDNNTIINNTNLRAGRQFFNSFRGYASSSNSTSSSNNSSSKKSDSSSGALTIEEEEEFDEITDKWIPEKPVTKAETAGYSMVIVLGLGLAASALFFASKELFMSPKESWRLSGFETDRVGPASHVGARREHHRVRRVEKSKSTTANSTRS